jgi:hypothetical protein
MAAASTLVILPKEGLPQAVSEAAHLQVEELAALAAAVAEGRALRAAKPAMWRATAREARL